MEVNITKWINAREEIFSKNNGIEKQISFIFVLIILSPISYLLFIYKTSNINEFFLFIVFIFGLTIISRYLEEKIIKIPKSEEIAYYLYIISQDIENLNVSGISKEKVKNNLSKLDEILDSIKLDKLFTGNIKTMLSLLHSYLKKTNTYVNESKYKGNGSLATRINVIAQAIIQNDNELSKEHENAIKSLNRFFESANIKESEINPYSGKFIVEKISSLWNNLTKPKNLIICWIVVSILICIMPHNMISLTDFEKISIVLLLPVSFKGLSSLRPK